MEKKNGRESKLNKAYQKKNGGGRKEFTEQRQWKTVVLG